MWCIECKNLHKWGFVVSSCYRACSVVARRWHSCHKKHLRSTPETELSRRYMTLVCLFIFRVNFLIFYFNGLPHWSFFDIWLVVGWVFGYLISMWFSLSNRLYHSCVFGTLSPRNESYHTNHSATEKPKKIN